MRLIVDAHLDLAWNAVSFGRDQTETIEVINARERGLTDSLARETACVSLPELRCGGIAACLATVLCRAKRDVCPTQGQPRIDLDYATQDVAYAMAQGQLAYYRCLEARGEMRAIRTAAELDEHIAQWQSAAEDAILPVGYILAMEGADPIVTPQQAEAWYEDGLRSLILAHYGVGHYADGTGATRGLTSKGRELLAEMERLGIILDLTHSTDQSFAEALANFTGPVMASHTNCRSLVPGDRQFSDAQIQQLIDRDAVMGVALDAWMLRPGWVRGESKPEGMTLETLIDHIDHYCQLAGNARHVAIGSDLDGGFGGEQRPVDVQSISELQKLGPLLERRGYSPEDVENIFSENWLRFFRKNLAGGVNHGGSLAATAAPSAIAECERKPCEKVKCSPTPRREMPRGEWPCISPTRRCMNSQVCPAWTVSGWISSITDTRSRRPAN